MTGESIASRVARARAAIRDTPLGPRVAIALWVVFAFCVWNVVFDRVLVLAGRQYVHAAATSAALRPAVYLRIDDWMRPAVAHGLRVATVSASGVLLVGLAGVAAASRAGTYGARARTRGTATSPGSLRRS